MRIAFGLLLFAAVSIAAQPRLEVAVPVEIDSKVMGERRTLLVRTPATYATGTRSYPVLYMTDGDHHIGHTAAVVDFLTREGRMPEVIIVGIRNTDRTRDLTPTREARVNGAFSAPNSGGGDRFLDFIEKEAIPYVEKSYRTQPYRVFAGHSFGGLFAMHAFLTRPSLFQALIAVSPTLTWDDRYVYRRATEWARNPPQRPATLVMSVGNEGAGLDREFDALAKLLRRNRSLSFEAIRMPGEDHGSVVLPTHYAALRKVFEPFRFVLDTPDEDPRKLLARAREHYAQLSERLGFTVPIPERTLNVIGYRFLQNDKVPEAIEAFRANAATWPDSANVYDSLGEALERSGALEDALASYRRAAQLGRVNGDPNLIAFQRNVDRLAKR
jgi:predicted alpha/beta superfamily hydrolase